MNMKSVLRGFLPNQMTQSAVHVHPPHKRQELVSPERIKNEVYACENKAFRGGGRSPVLGGVVKLDQTWIQLLDQDSDDVDEQQEVDLLAEMGGVGGQGRGSAPG